MRKGFLVRGVGTLAAIALTAGATMITVGRVLLASPATAVDPTYVPAGAPLPILVEVWGDSDMAPFAAAPPGGAYLEAGAVRVPAPRPPQGARRVGLQVGHWKAEEAPDELRRLRAQTGTTWNGLREPEVTLAIAERVAALLRARGFVVDILPSTVPEGYVADVFLALHADGDGSGEHSGFKLAHGGRRGPFEDALVRVLRDEYGKATGLEWDARGLFRNMQGYYAFSWSRYQHAVNAHTPAAILELGYLSNDADRALMVDHPDVVASGIASGLARFLAETPRAEIFARDLSVRFFSAEHAGTP